MLQILKIISCYFQKVISGIVAISNWIKIHSLKNLIVSKGYCDDFVKSRFKGGKYFYPIQVFGCKKELVKNVFKA